MNRIAWPENSDQCSLGLLRAFCIALAVLLFSSALLAQATSSQAGELQHARTLLDTPRWRDAEPIVNAYLEHNPASADGYALLGLILYREHEPRASMAEYLHASKLAEPSAFDLRIFALDCAAIPDFPEAERWLERSIEKDDRSAATWEALGHVRFAQQKYEGAIDALNHALAIAPHTVSSQSMIGLANERLAKTEAALEAYRAAIASEAGTADQDPVPYVGTGRVLLADDRAAAAIPFLHKAASSTHATSEAHELLGLAYSKTDHNSEAAAELEAAIRLDPNSARLHLMLARIWRASGEMAKAQAEQAQYATLKASGAQ